MPPSSQEGKLPQTPARPMSQQSSTPLQVQLVVLQVKGATTNPLLGFLVPSLSSLTLGWVVAEGPPIRINTIVVAIIKQRIFMRFPFFVLSRILCHTMKVNQQFAKAKGSRVAPPTQLQNRNVFLFCYEKSQPNISTRFSEVHEIQNLKF